MATTSCNASREAAEPGAEWFYTQHGETYGPVSSNDLRAAAHIGFLGPNDFVRRNGDTVWRTARSIRGLFKEEDV